MKPSGDPRISGKHLAGQGFRPATDVLGRREDRNPGVLSTLQEIVVAGHQWCPGGVCKGCKLSVSRIRNILELVWVRVTLEPILFAEERRDVIPG